MHESWGLFKKHYLANQTWPLTEEFFNVICLLDLNFKSCWPEMYISFEIKNVTTYFYSSNFKINSIQKCLGFSCILIDLLIFKHRCTIIWIFSHFGKLDSEFDFIINHGKFSNPTTVFGLLPWVTRNYEKFTTPWRIARDAGVGWEGVI